MGKTNRICKTCGKAYYYCSNCNKSVNSPQWMLMWDTENCKNIFEIVSSYAQGVCSKEDAQKRLEKCNLKEKYSFNEKISQLIDEILAKEEVKETKPVEAVEIKKEEKIEDTVPKKRLFEKPEKNAEDEK